MAEAQNSPDPAVEQEVVVPLAGSQITPLPIAPVPADPTPIAPVEPAAQATPAPVAPQTEAVSPETVASPEAEEHFVKTAEASAAGAGDEFQDSLQADQGAEPVTWTAAEFIAHDKSAMWFMGLFVAVVIIAILIYVATRDFVSVAVVVVAGILLGVYGTHRPREQQYVFDSRGFSVGSKSYRYEQFKSFSVLPEDGFSTITMMPLKRFGLQVTMHCPAEAEEAAVNAVGNQLPLAEPSRDHVDSLMRKIHF